MPRDPDSAPSTPSKPPFPWWLVGILGGGLLLVAVVVVSFFLHGNPPPRLGSFCAQEEPRCSQGLVCSEDNLCLGPEGFACSSSGECASHECRQGACAPPAPEPRR